MDKSDIIACLKDFSDTPELDAVYLSEAASSDGQLQDWIERRQAGEPVAKIIGRKGFWKRDFIVSDAVLDPRPDSETMIDAVLSVYLDKGENLRFLDLGTGSGCLLLSVLDEYPNAVGVGVEKSQRAFEIATKNGQDCSRAKFVCRDWNNFSDFDEPFDIVLSNPPYIPFEDKKMLPKDTLFDPEEALFADENGLAAYRELSAVMPPFLKKDGLVFLEIGIGQKNGVVNLMTNAGFVFLKSYTDFGGVERILSFKRKD